MKKTYLLPCLLFIFSFQILSGQQDSARIANIKEVRIYPNFRAYDNYPITFQTISMMEIDRKSTGQEPSFLFSETPSITVYSDAGNTQGYSYMRLRGIDQTRISNTLDGVPLSRPEETRGYIFPTIPTFSTRLLLYRFSVVWERAKTARQAMPGACNFNRPT
ncbi:MAG: TonB-dependent receptor plug domain-containing protein [Bacteroidia bacterium]